MSNSYSYASNEVSCELVGCVLPQPVEDWKVNKHKPPPLFPRARREQRVSNRLRDNLFEPVFEPGQTVLLFEFPVDGFPAPFQSPKRHTTATIGMIRIEPDGRDERIPLPFERGCRRKPARAMRESCIPTRGVEAVCIIAGRLLSAVGGGRDAVALARRARAVERLSELPCDLCFRLATEPLGSCSRGLYKLLTALLHGWFSR